MLIVTHEMKFARDVSTRIFYMQDGVIYEDGPAAQVFESPRRSATKDFVRRIRKEVFEIDGPDFDFLDMGSRIQQFCLKYNIPEISNRAPVLCQMVMPAFLEIDKPLTVRITHSELSGDVFLDFMVEGVEESPLDAGLRKEIVPLCKDVIEEPTARGFRVRMKMD